MTFCSFCGKQLADGEVCTCQQNNAQQAAPQQPIYAQPAPAPAPQPKKASASDNVIKTVFGHIVNTVKKPITAAEEYYEKGTAVSSGIIIALVAISYLFMTVCNLIITILYRLSYLSKSTKAARKVLGGISVKEYLALGEFYNSDVTTKWEYLNYYGIKGGTIVQSIFFPIIYVVLMSAVIIGIVYLVNALILKNKTDITKTLNLMASASVPLIGSCVFMVLRQVFHVGFLQSAFFPIAISVCGLITLLQVLVVLKKEITDRKQYVLSLIFAVAVLTIAHYVIWYLIMRHCTVYVSFPM